LNGTADALTDGIKMISRQPRALNEMIAPRVGNCKCFNKFDQGRIYFA